MIEYEDDELQDAFEYTIECIRGLDYTLGASKFEENLEKYNLAMNKYLIHIDERGFTNHPKTIELVAKQQVLIGKLKEEAYKCQ